jgi:hypothetical protein
MAVTTAPRRKLPPRSAETSDRCYADRPVTQSNGIETHSLKCVSSANARHALIAVAAHQRAQLRGFIPGEDLQDWLAAEREVDALLDPDR